VTNNLE